MSAISAGRGYSARGEGWILFAGIILMMVGVLNAIWGIAAIGSAAFFNTDASYILSNLDTWGWVTLVVGVGQIAAALSVWRGGSFGRWLGIAVAVVSAVVTLMSISAYPFWALAIFAVDVLVVYALAAYGGDPRIAPAD